MLPKKQDNTFYDKEVNPIELDTNSDELLHGMAVCHSLAYIKNELKGDPLDLIMFESTKWILQEPSDIQEESGAINVRIQFAAMISLLCNNY